MLDEAFTEQFAGLFAYRMIGRAGGVEFHDAALLVRRPAVIAPVGEVERAVRAEVDAGGHRAVVRHVFAHHLEAGTVRFSAECADVFSGELGHEKVALIFFVERGARVVGKTARAVGVVGNGRGEVGRLPVEVRFPEAIGHPRVVAAVLGKLAVAAVLPRGAPAGVGALEQVVEPFAVAEVAVVVDDEPVAVLVVRQLLRIAQAVGEHLEV